MRNKLAWVSSLLLAAPFLVSAQVVPGIIVVSTSPTPVAQTLAPGSVNTTVAQFNFDASGSSEDVRFPTMSFYYTDSAPVDPSNCGVYDGITRLSVPSIEPAGTGNKTFILSSPFVVAKGTVKTVSLNCSLSLSASGSFRWGAVATGGRTPFSGVGVTTGFSVTPRIASSTSGNLMRVASASSTAKSLSISLDASSPSYTVVTGGAQAVTVGVYKLRSSVESVNIAKLGVKLSSGKAGDVQNVYFYSGTTLLGTAVFAGTNTTAVSTLIFPLSVPKDVDTRITIKADIAGIGLGQLGSTGDLVKIDLISADGTGVSSGLSVHGTGTGSTAGVRMFRSFPIVSLGTLPSSALVNGSNSIMRFAVTANAAGMVGLNRIGFSVVSGYVTVGGLTLYAFSDPAYSTAISGQGAGGQIPVTQTGSSFTAAPITPIEIQPGSTVYFELRATISGSTVGSSVTATLLGDSVYESIGTSVSRTGAFVWSPNTNTTSQPADTDWTNGYGIIGLPAQGVTQTRTASAGDRASNLAAVFTAIQQALQLLLSPLFQ